MKNVMQYIESVTSGQKTVFAIVKDVLAKINSETSKNNVWVNVNCDDAISQANEVDKRLSSGEKLDLAGLCVGVKDIFSIKNYELTLGLTPKLDYNVEQRLLHKSHNHTKEVSILCHSDKNTVILNKNDAELISDLKSKGAVVIGTTSLPPYSLGRTKNSFNPYDMKRTAGSSSTGSALAVAMGHVPISVAMQTNASIIRPAAFCGIAAYKPSQGLLSTEGAARLVPTLDQPGFMAKNIDDLLFLHDVLLQGTKKKQLDFAFVRTDMWQSHAEAHMQESIERLIRKLNCIEIILPKIFKNAWKALDTIMNYELSQNISNATSLQSVDFSLVQAIEKGNKISENMYKECLSYKKDLEYYASKHLQSYAIISPASSGIAPLLEEGSGSPVFSSLWSFIGAACVTVPFYRQNNLPVGIQLINTSRNDRCLLESAQDLIQYL